MGSSKKVTVGYRYYMGLQMVLCKGPVDAVGEIQVGERSAWRGAATADQQTVTVNAPDLFGGDEREGGVAGQLDIMMGTATQTANAYLTARQGTRQSGLRGIVSAILRQGLVSSNNPYLKPWAFKVRRILKGWKDASGSTTPWNSADAMVLLDGGTRGLLTENFPSKAGFTQLWGNASLTTIGTSAHGSTIDLTGPADGQRSGVLKAITPIISPTVISFKVLVEAGADRGSATLRFGPRNNEVPFVAEAPWSFGTVGIGEDLPYQFSFDARSQVDASRRPRFLVGGLNVTYFGGGIWVAPSQHSFFLGSSALTDGQWYTIRLQIDRVSGAYTCTVHNADTNALVSTTTGTSPAMITNTRIDYMAVYHDVMVATGRNTRFAALSLGDIALLGAMNPAHIVYECLTNVEWGMGRNLNDGSSVNLTSFGAAADVFLAEGMGLCLEWKQQTKLKDFVQVVLDHCGAILAQNPSTGAFELTPLRGGYDPGTLPLYDESNLVRVEHYDRGTIQEAVNEIQVKFDDGFTGKQGSVKVQNLAHITAIGAVVQKSVNYPGLPTAELANRIGMRDLTAQSTPLARATLIADRTAYALKPGSLIRWSWPKLGITTMVLRVITVNHGRAGAGEIRLQCVQDVFGVPAAVYAAQQPDAFIDPVTLPAYPTFRRVREASWYEIVRELGQDDAEGLDDDAGFVVATAVRPSGDSMDYGLWTRVGAAQFQENGRSGFAPSGVTSAPVTAAALSMTLVGLQDANGILAGGYGLLDDEMIRVDAWDATTGAMTIGRGIMGTVAAAHAGGARFFFLDGYTAADVIEHVDGETVNVRFSSRTGQGDFDVLNHAEAIEKTDSIKMSQLWLRPYPPGRLLFGAALYPTSVNGGLHFEWFHRNRLQQNLEGDESNSIGPEPGTTYNARLIDATTNTVIDSATGITGTTWAPTTMPSAPGLLRFELESVRDGLVSAQTHRHTFSWADGHTVYASLIAGSASGGAGGTSVAQGRVLAAASSLIPGSAYAVN